MRPMNGAGRSASTVAARIEGCSRATIYWRLHEAKKRLALSLREHALP